MPYATSLSPQLAPVRDTRILIAEDDPQMRRLIELALSHDGYDVDSVGSGLQLFDALRIAHQAGALPDLIVADIHMPGMSGLQVIASLRRRGWNRPTVLITAFCDEETLDEAARLGNSVLFSKPFDLDDLRTAVMCLFRPRERCQDVHGSGVFDFRAPLASPRDK